MGDLAVHEERRQSTADLIAKFDAAGQTWLADQNRTVFAQLDQRISEIRNSNTLVRQNSEAHHVA